MLFICQIRENMARRRELDYDRRWKRELQVPKTHFEELDQEKKNEQAAAF